VLTLLRLLLAASGSTRFSLARMHVPPLVRLLSRIATLAAMIGWLLYALQSFRLLRPAERLLGAAMELELSLGDFSLTLGHAVAFVLAIALAIWASRLTRLLLRDLMGTDPAGARGIGSSVASLASYAVLLLGALVALSAAGVKGSQLAIVFGALGVGIGFGLQNIVNNFVSGLILMFERPLQSGDVVDVGGTVGRVNEIGMRATRIKTFEGADVVVPNGSLLSAQFTNWTLLDRNRRIEISVGVAYGSSPAQVLELLTQCAASTGGVASAPPPTALMTGFGDSSLEFVLRAWTHTFDDWVAIRSELLVRVHDALQQAGIAIPFPQRDVHLYTTQAPVSGHRDATDAEGGADPER